MAVRGRAFPAEEPASAWFCLRGSRGHGAGKQSGGRRSEVMGDAVGTQAFTLSEEGSGRVLSTGCCVLNCTVIGSPWLLGRKQGEEGRERRGTGEEH